MNKKQILNIVLIISLSANIVLTYSLFHKHKLTSNNNVTNDVFTAVKNDNLTLLDKLLRCGLQGPGNNVDALWKSPLDYAVEYGHIKSVKRLLVWGAGPAAGYRNFDELIEKAYSIKRADIAVVLRREALGDALSFGMMHEIRKYAIPSVINRLDVKGCTPLTFVVGNRDDISASRIVPILLKQGADKVLNDGHGYTPLNLVERLNKPITKAVILSWSK